MLGQMVGGGHMVGLNSYTQCHTVYYEKKVMICVVTHTNTNIKRKRVDDIERNGNEEKLKERKVEERIKETEKRLRKNENRKTE